MDRAAPIGIVGTGYVGLVSAVCFAHLGHHVVCMDVDAAKIARLQKGDVPIYEPGLDKLIDDNASRLSFTTSYDELLEACHILFIAVDTPPSPSGDADRRGTIHGGRHLRVASGSANMRRKSTIGVGGSPLRSKLRRGRPCAARVQRPVACSSSKRLAWSRGFSDRARRNAATAACLRPKARSRRMPCW